MIQSWTNDAELPPHVSELNIDQNPAMTEDRDDEMEVEEEISEMKDEEEPPKYTPKDFERGPWLDPQIKRTGEACTITDIMPTAMPWLTV